MVSAPEGVSGEVKAEKAALATFGTLGDIYPFIAIAHALTKRGIEPTIVAPGMYRGAIEREGVRHACLRPDDRDIAEALGTDARGLLEGMKKPHFILDEIYMRFLRETYDDVLRAASQADIIFTHSLLVGAAQAAEMLRLPCARVALAPLHLQSAKSPPMTPGAPYCLSAEGCGAATYNRLVRGVVRLVTNKRMHKLRAFRATVGLPPTREDFFLDFGRANTANIIFGLFSPRFCPVQPDHPKNLIIPGFPFYESRDPERGTLDIGLEAFLAAGEPPIVFTLGSFAIEASDGFFDQSLRAARALRRRAVLLTGEKDAARLTSLMTAQEYVCARAPHSLLFPRALCIVHHGGIGTTAEAMRAGKPQVVVPFFGDQPDHAMRVMRLGIGLSMSPSNYDEHCAADALRKLLAGDFKEEAGRLAALIAGERGVEEVADWASSILQNSRAAA
jgi:UDP:flavonoid glycosyltransferase YjiC (YdhE family)